MRTLMVRALATMALVGLCASLRALPSRADEPEAQSATPAKIEGTWTWTWKDQKDQTHRHTIEVEGVGEKVAAREIYDDETPVKVTNLKLKGKDLKFTVVRGERRSDYSGKVADADHINGTVTVTVEGTATDFEWTAERRKDIPK